MYDLIVSYSGHVYSAPARALLDENAPKFIKSIWPYMLNVFIKYFAYDNDLPYFRQSL